MRILLVDDDVYVRKALHTALLAERDEIEIREAGSGSEALSICRGFHPDVVFLDYWMPDMDGEATAKSIRALLPGARIISFSGLLEEKPGWADDHYVKGQFPDVEAIIRLDD